MNRHRLKILCKDKKDDMIEKQKFLQKSFQTINFFYFIDEKCSLIVINSIVKKERINIEIFAKEFQR